MSTNDELDLSPKCAAGVNALSRVKTLERDNIKQWDAIEKLQSRLPVWATVVMTLMGTMLGSALTFASLASKIKP